MKHRLRHQLAATLLALCVVISGFVGLNPTLHRLVEHAGHGAPHTHRGGETHWHDPGDGTPHRHEASIEISFPSPDKRLERVFQSHPFGSLPIREILAGLLKLWTDYDSSNEPHTDHQHHSLAQSLSDGLVETALTWVASAVPSPTFSWVATPSRDFFPASEWSPHTASRAPPVFLG